MPLPRSAGEEVREVIDTGLQKAEAIVVGQSGQSVGCCIIQCHCSTPCVSLRRIVLGSSQKPAEVATPISLQAYLKRKYSWPRSCRLSRNVCRGSKIVSKILSVFPYGLQKVLYKKSFHRWQSVLSNYFFRHRSRSGYSKC